MLTGHFESYPAIELVSKMAPHLIAMRFLRGFFTGFFFLNNRALFFSEKKETCFYQSVKSDYLEIPRVSFVSSMSIQNVSNA